jgi:hypothetical protein
MIKEELNFEGSVKGGSSTRDVKTPEPVRNPGSQK